MARASHRRPGPSLPAWLHHPLRVARGPVPYGTVMRGAVTTGPLLAAGIATHHTPWGVLAALGAAFATVNDQPGTRRTRMARIGVPAAAGALGIVLGGLLATFCSPADGAPDGWWVVPALVVAGYLSGTVSVIGSVASSAALEFLVILLIGAGMPPPGAVWTAPALVAGGALWHLLVVLATRPQALREERAAVAAVYDRLADVLAAAGGGEAAARRREFTAALGRAHAVVDHHRGLRRLRRASAAERLLRAQLAVAGVAGEAAVSLLWEGRPLPSIVPEEARHLAEAVRADRPYGPVRLPAPETDGLRALCEAWTDASAVFLAAEHAAVAAQPVRLRDHPGTRRALGPLGRAYGLRVALCVGACTAVAVTLHPAHWTWLPITAAFLAKPDMGPLFSRVVSRVFGTLLGVAGYLVLSAALPGNTGTVVTAAIGGALVPVAARHFAFLTAALTGVVLAMAGVGGAAGAPGDRLTDTLLGCLVAFAVGHLPRLGGRRSAVHESWAAALRAAQAYLCHVVATPIGTPAELARVRRAAYQALTDAHAVLLLAAAELPPAGVPTTRWAPPLAALEDLVDATTTCAVRVRNGHPLPSDESRRLADALARLAADASARRGTEWPSLPTPAELSGQCVSLADVARHLHSVRRLTQAA